MGGAAGKRPSAREKVESRGLGTSWLEFKQGGIAVEKKGKKKVKQRWRGEHILCRSKVLNGVGKAKR